MKQNLPGNQARKGRDSLNQNRIFTSRHECIPPLQGFQKSVHSMQYSMLCVKVCGTGWCSKSLDFCSICLLWAMAAKMSGGRAFCLVFLVTIFAQVHAYLKGCMPNYLCNVFLFFMDRVSRRRWRGPVGLIKHWPPARAWRVCSQIWSSRDEYQWL